MYFISGSKEGNGMINPFLTAEIKQLYITIYKIILMVNRSIDDQYFLMKVKIFKC